MTNEEHEQMRGTMAGRAELVRRQVLGNPGVKDCCKQEGAIEVTTEDGERFTGTCRTCGCKHRRAFVSLDNLAKAMQR